jgi:N-acetylmuramoyl-L-alanine amidase
MWTSGQAGECLASPQNRGRATGDSLLREQKNFHKAFARVSPVFVLRALFALSALSVAAICWFAGAAGAAASEADNSAAAVKRQAASSQFLRAEEQRSALNSKPLEKRTLAEYKQTVASYRRVTLITPRAAEVPDALVDVAELFTEMGDRFGRSYYQTAVDTYGYLAREYPTSKYCQDSLLRAAKLQRNQLGDLSGATKTYDAFLKRYPRSPRKREALEGMAEIALLQNGERPEAPEAINSTPARNAAVNRAEMPAPEPAATSADERSYDRTVVSRDVIIARGNDVQSGGAQSSDLPYAPRVRRIRASSSGADGEATRVVIDLEGSVEYSSARISNPERIFFDLHAARLTPEVARGNIPVDGRLLTAVRVAQNQAGVVRVVLDVNGVKDYTASLSSNPPQLIVDLYGTLPNRGPEKGSGTSTGDAPVRTTRLKHDARMPPPGAVPVEDTRANTNTTSDYGTSADIGPDASVIPASKIPVAAVTPSGAPALQRATEMPPAVVDNGVVSQKSQRAKQLRATNAGTKPDLIRPTSVPTATRDGGSTLSRTLGLKIGRIVIDAGHGGHDTGTIGPTGLMEKDLCLDVALRLGKIIEQKLPGAEVVYTRSDDTFIPLEERTNIANQAKADLFISIHANSSPDHAARGIETYYLNLRGSPEAMEVAARENATSAEGIHDLQDVVRQIARTEKIDESKEFAEDVQDSLSKRIQRSAKTVKNRGVHKAPFVVLIGADMPSILTEISFLSNPADEQLLKKPEQRQHVAEGIFSGVSSYLESMNSVALNQSGKTARPRAAAALEQSSNQK